MPVGVSVEHTHLAPSEISQMLLQVYVGGAVISHDTSLQVPVSTMSHSLIG